MRDRKGNAYRSEQPGFWEKLRECAVEILDSDIAALRKKIIDPSHCINSRDRVTMTVRQEELRGLLRSRKMLDSQGPRAKLTALGIVLESRPELLRQTVR